MENLKNTIQYTINEELVKAKESIENDLYAKLGKALEEKLMEYAPSIFNEEKEEDEEEDEKDDSEDSEDEGNEESDESDEDDEESDDEDEDEDEKEINEEFENQLLQSLTSLIEEIEEEQGRELTNEEVEYVTAHFINEYATLNEKEARWQDSDGDGKWYEPGDDVKSSKKKKKKG